MKNDFQVLCNCGCDNGFAIKFRFTSDQGDVIFISTLTAGFSAYQTSFFYRIARRIQAAWFMLRGKEFYLHEITLNKEQWDDFVATVNNVDL